MSTTISCTCGWDVNVSPGVLQRLRCPECLSTVELNTPSSLSMPSRPASTAKHGSTYWAPLHQYAIDHSQEWNPTEAQHWYQEWCESLPQTDCSCRVAWDQLTSRHPPNFVSAAAFFRWTIDRHNDVNRSIGKSQLLVSDALMRYRFPFKRGEVQALVSWDEFTRDTLSLAQQILERYPSISGIAGCPRSGMRAACDIALRLDIPLYEASAEYGLRRCSGGSRLHKADIHGIRQEPNDGTIVIVEDSTCSGTSIRELRQHDDLREMPIFAVYAGNHGRELADGYAVSLDLPHWFEWNFFNSGLILRQNNVGIDWDGVLNEDCPPEDDDDAKQYLTWLDSVRPIRMPRAFCIPYIITARREAYRPQCEDWLRRYSINYGQLIMFPGTFSERLQTDIGRWKAEMCEEHGVGLFVESSLLQARKIAEFRGRSVLCVESVQASSSNSFRRK